MVLSLMIIIGLFLKLSFFKRCRSKLFSSISKIKIYRANVSSQRKIYTRTTGQEFITYPISTRIPTNSFKIIRETRPSRARKD